MEAKLTFKYDREADILYINKREPYPEQDSEELARRDRRAVESQNPRSGEPGDSFLLDAPASQ